MSRRKKKGHKNNFRLVTRYLHCKHKKVSFNRHHRLPECRGGKITSSNCVLVDVESHNAFNALVLVASRLCCILEKFVCAEHIAFALNTITRIFDYSMRDEYKNVAELKSAHDIKKDESYQLLLRFASMLKHVKMRNVLPEHLDYAVMKIRTISRIIAGSRHRLLRPDRLVKQFNSIWLPDCDPIHYGYWAEKKKRKKHHK